MMVSEFVCCNIIGVCLNYGRFFPANKREEQEAKNVNSKETKNTKEIMMKRIE